MSDLVKIIEQIIVMDDSISEEEKGNPQGKSFKPQPNRISVKSLSYIRTIEDKDSKENIHFEINFGQRLIKDCLTNNLIKI